MFTFNSQEVAALTEHLNSTNIDLTLNGLPTVNRATRGGANVF
jgi:hypothetical protein